jgi:hypothetical protein
MPITKAPRPVPGLKTLHKSPAPLPSRPAVIPVRPVVMPQLAQQRAVRREAIRQVANQIQPGRPRPVVRPAAPPLRIMPTQPQPALKSLQKAAPAAAPARPQAAMRPAALRPTPAGAVAIGAALAGATAVGLSTVNTTNVHADLSAEVSVLQSSISDLQTRSMFGAVQSEMNDLDQLVNRVVELLESARQKGYAFQGDLENLAYSAHGQWQTAYPQVTARLNQQASMLQNRLLPVNSHVNSLNANLGNPAAAAPILRGTQSQVNGLLAEVARIEADLRQGYQSINAQAQSLNSRLTTIHWAMDQLAGAKFVLPTGEGLVVAVPARWDKEGKDDPEGILYLTNRRLIFERKEKVATKKILFITTASELVQEVVIDQPVGKISACEAENKGLFGHQDFLQVKFAGEPGDVALHINGQGAKDWAAWIEKVRSGQIENERASAAAGISISDLTRPLSMADVVALQGQVNTLQDEMMLKGPRQEIETLENDTNLLERKLSVVRTRGYQIEKDLEGDATVLLAQWSRVKNNTQATIDYQAAQLGGQMRGIQDDLARLVGMSASLGAARPLYMQLKSAVASAEAQADAAEATVLAQYDEFADEVESMMAHLEWVDWMLDAISTASFQLLATESGVAAVEAVFQHPDWEPENGVLFLTDQRLLWEDRVGTYELKVNVPLQDVLEVKAEGDETGEQNALVFQFGAQGPVPVARFLISQPVTDDWLMMVGRARSGGYAQDRVTPITQEELDRVRNAPQQCSKCGAGFTAPILRGQTEIHCEYCGNVVRF